MSLDFDTIHREMLTRIPDRYQKTAGFPAYDFTAAFAQAVLSLDDDIATAEANLNVDNLTGVALDEFVKQHRGIIRKYATYATAELQVVTGAGSISAGDLFSTESGVQFYAIADSDVETGSKFTVRAYNAGETGNVDANTITYMPITIAGISAVTNPEPSSGGYDSETDDELRERYYDDLQNPNNGANQQAYIAWATSVAGVGRVKIFPQAQGKNTVEVCILDANQEPAGAPLIQQVQALIDPNHNGDGVGEAPIGAVCTVTTGTAKYIDVVAKITLADGASIGSVKTKVQAALTEYLRGLAFEKTGTYVSYSQIASRINATQGVLDHSNLTVAGGTTNVALGDRETPMLGEVTLTVVS